MLLPTSVTFPLFSPILHLHPWLFICFSVFLFFLHPFPLFVVLSSSQSWSVSSFICFELLSPIIPCPAVPCVPRPPHNHHLHLHCPSMTPTRTPFLPPVCVSPVSLPPHPSLSQRPCQCGAVALAVCGVQCEAVVVEARSACTPCSSRTAPPCADHTAWAAASAPISTTPHAWVQNTWPTQGRGMCVCVCSGSVFVTSGYKCVSVYVKGVLWLVML